MNANEERYYKLIADYGNALAIHPTNVEEVKSQVSQIISSMKSIYEYGIKNGLPNLCEDIRDFKGMFKNCTYWVTKKLKPIKLPNTDVKITWLIANEEALKENGKSFFNKFVAFTPPERTPQDIMRPLFESLSMAWENMNSLGRI